MFVYFKLKLFRFFLFVSVSPPSTGIEAIWSYFLALPKAVSVGYRSEIISFFFQKYISKTWKKSRWLTEGCKWLRQQGCPWHMLVCAYAVKNGFLHMLQWVRLQQPPCPWDDATTLAAVICGDLATLKWAAFHGCVIDVGSCEHAAKNGHLQVMKILRVHDCQWNKSTCRCAPEYGHIEVLIWARANGCPWQLDECRFYAQKKRHSEVVRWIDKQIII